MKLKNNQGTLRRWLNGFGFIRFDGRDVFVHRDAYLRGFKPEVGQIVLFDFGLAPDKNRPPVAINVRVSKSVKAIADEIEIKRGLEVLVTGDQGGAA
jgi:cold shock CspA family protein